ncbi:MAG: hypothetical protein NTU53_19400 [Planctomycetota bacterium]|nr:hypothetical protein [Planctomycetota bacterium]
MSFLSPYQRARILLLSASIACFCIFWWAGAIFRIPVHPGHEASLLQQPSPVVALLVVAVVLVLCVAVGTAIAGMVRYDAGLVAGAIGLAALSARGGSVQHSIFWGLAHGNSSALFLVLLVETAILAVLVGLCAWALARLYRNGIVRDRESNIALAIEPSISGEVATLLVQTVLTAIGMLVLARSPVKQQAIAAVAISSFVGAALTESLLPIASRALCWLPPMLVGMIGYAAVWSDPAGYLTGNLSSSFSALAVPLPLDYASAGPAGALLGYWMGRRWARQRTEAGEASTPHPA